MKPDRLIPRLVLAFLLFPAAVAAEPAQVAAERAVGPLRSEPGDGLCATLVSIRDANSPPFADTASAIEKLNTPVGQGRVGDRQVHAYTRTRFHNRESTSVGDFQQQPAEDFPYERNFAARFRGYINIDHPETVHTNAMYAVAGAWMRIGGEGEPFIEFNSNTTVRMTRQVRYSKAGLYPIEIIYYANGGIAVLEASAAATPEMEGSQTSLDTGKFHLIPGTQLYTARVGTGAPCAECADDGACGGGNYCVHDWAGGGRGPDGICQPCAVNDHCGSSCTACSGMTPICSKGACVQCTQDLHCPPGQGCDTGASRCVPRSACHGNTDCPMGLACEPASGKCIPSCAQGGCPEQLVCNAALPTPACVPPCSSDAQCPANYRCKTQDMMCEPLPPDYIGGTNGCSASNRLPAPVPGLFLLLPVFVCWRRRVLRRLGALLPVLLLPATARADLSANAATFQPALGPDSLMVVDGTATPAPWKAVLTGVLAYDYSPLRLRSASGEVLANTVSQLAGLHLLGTLGVNRRLAFGVDVPLVLYQGFDARTPATDVPGAPSSAGIADLRAAAKVRLVNNERGGFGLAFAPLVTFPTGKGSDLRGSDSFDIQPRLALDYRLGGSLVAANLGFVGRTSSQQVGSTLVGHEVTYGLGYLRALPKGFALLWEVSGGLGVQTAPGGRLYAPTEMYGSVRWSHPSGVIVTVGSGGGLTNAVGSPEARTFASVGFLPIGATGGAGRGAGPRAGSPPEARGSTPGQAQPQTSTSTTTTARTGPPAGPERGGNGAGPKDDGKVAQNPPVSARPEAGTGAPAPLESCRLRVDEPIRFRTASTEIDPASYAVLDRRVLSVLREHPTVRLRIEGNTDAQPYRDHERHCDLNPWLSRKRAEAVKRYLVERGIDGSRLETIGYGSSNPLADAAVPAANRRTEFKRLDNPACKNPPLPVPPACEPGPALKTPAPRREQQPPAPADSPCEVPPAATGT